MCWGYRGGMEEIGRFRLGGKEFFGRVEGGQVVPLLAAPWLGGEPCGDPVAWEELVVLPPCTPASVALLGYEEHFWGQWSSPGILHPHRTMIPQAYPDHQTEAVPALAVLLSSQARRVKPAAAQGLVYGVAPALVMFDRAVEKSDGGAARACSFPGYLVLGPLVRAGWPSVGERVSLHHNGSCSDEGEAVDWLERFGETLAWWTDAAVMSAGDCLLLPASHGAAIQPGDHLEVRMGQRRTLAVNVGMRGSA